MADKKDTGGGGMDIVGLLISIMISIVVGVTLIPIIIESINQVPGMQDAPATTGPAPYIPPTLLPTIGVPTWALALLSALLIGLVVAWFLWRRRNRQV